MDFSAAAAQQQRDWVESSQHVKISLAPSRRLPHGGFLFAGLTRGKLGNLRAVSGVMSAAAAGVRFDLIKKKSKSRTPGN